MYEIEKGIPIPPRKKGGQYHSKYGWREMEVGDSKFIPNEKQSKITTISIGYGKRHKQKFIVRTVEGGVRVWRVA